jgi:hypothetical protein
MVPLHDRKLSGWDVLVNKVADKLSNWSDSLFSFGGRGDLHSLIQYYQFVPLYMISLYKVLMFVKKKIRQYEVQIFLTRFI